MIISRIEEVGRHKYKIYLDGEYAFILYTTDLRTYQIKEGEMLSTETYEEILLNTVYRRAKQKAMAILKRMDRTEQELRQKLAQDYYTEEQITVAMDYVKKYGYIDDERYVSNYINSKKNSKSRREIQYKLEQKGINRMLIQQYLEEEEVDDETAIVRAIKKKTDDVTQLDPEKKAKLIASLCRKGFSYEKIRKYL